jgi:hypothetical protein
MGGMVPNAPLATGEATGFEQTAAADEYLL